MQLRATFRNAYRNETGKLRYVFELTGSDEAIQQYLQDRRDEGYPSVNSDGEEEAVMHQGKIIPNGTWVKRNDRGRWYPDMFELEALNSLKEQFPHLDDETLKSFIKPPATTAKVKASEDDIDLDV